MTRLIAALCLLATSSAAQDFSATSTARSWNLYGETPANFNATVVDILCELSGDCPANCGNGRRQLGLVRSADGVLVFPNKNSQPAFTGAALELLPFCGREVEVDGLMIEDPDVGAQNIYLVQKIRAAGDPEWIKANRWTREWARENGKGKGPWFRRDPRVNAQIEAHGYTGLGVEAEKDFVREWLE